MAYNPFDQMAYNLGLQYGMGLSNRADEGDSTKAKRDLINLIDDDNSTSISNNAMLQALRGNNSYSQKLNQQLEGAGYGQGSNDGTYNIAGAFANNTPSASTPATSDTATTSAYADSNVDLGSRYLNLINGAKLEYQIAQKLGDEAGMARANAKAEQARADAETAGAVLPSKAQSATSGSYSELQDEMNAIRQKQQQQSVSDFMNAAGNYSKYGVAPLNLANVSSTPTVEAPTIDTNTAGSQLTQGSAINNNPNVIPTAQEAATVTPTSMGMVPTSNTVAGQYNIAQAYDDQYDPFGVKKKQTNPFSLAY